MKNILIVDDQTEVRELVEVTLAGTADYNIIKAENGKEAVEIAKNEKLDLIIMDVMMPFENDGLNATKAIRQELNNKDVKIIMLTAKGQDTDKKKGYEAGADEYFTKPFSPLDLITKVEEILG
jgi:DNA-binding response OmpR family regulator